MDQDQDRLFRLPFHLPNRLATRKVGVYLAGALYVLGIWLFVDCLLYSKYVNASKLHVTFVDWIPVLCSTSGMLVVSMIDKNRLLEDALASGSFVGSNQRAWQAQMVLFLGFALLAGGFAGALAVLVLKFLVKGYNTYPVLTMGVNNVLGNLFIMLSCVVLWMAQSVEDEYSYSLTL
ncbi:AaceriADL169Wp [[Ashbya] aceris (nom. inval.)]|nr:AaceriADL169Wp [[Ashbya] aceris (nom. inval.)]